MHLKEKKKTKTNDTYRGKIHLKVTSINIDWIFGLLAKVRVNQTTKEVEEYWLLLSWLIALNDSEKERGVFSNQSHKWRPENKNPQL